MRDRHMVYKCLDTKDELLYVGVTSNIKSRMKQHRNNSFWFKDTNKIIAKIYDTRKEADLAEARIIRKNNPIYNIMGRMRI